MQKRSISNFTDSELEVLILLQRVAKILQMSKNASARSVTKTQSLHGNGYLKATPEKDENVDDDAWYTPTDTVFHYKLNYWIEDRHGGPLETKLHEWQSVRWALELWNRSNADPISDHQQPRLAPKKYSDQWTYSARDEAPLREVHTRCLRLSLRHVECQKQGGN
jgi:hypothetical protein